MSMLNHVPAELRATFCAATHTIPTPEENRAAQLASAIAEERLTLGVLQHKLHDLADFAVQLQMSVSFEELDLTDLIEYIDNARAEVRDLMGQGQGKRAEPLFGTVFPTLTIRGE